MPKVVFLLEDGIRKEVNAKLGSSVLDVAHENGIDLEGACGGSVACSTCHVYVAPQWLDQLTPASDEEMDMLDLAFEVRESSRLGCQIKITEDLDGLEVTVPSYSRNLHFP